MKSKISCFSPVYGTPPDRLARSIDSIRAQRYGIWEILTAVDGGPEESWAAAVDLNIRVLIAHGSENRGLAASANTALTHATGEFLAKIDSDVELAPFWLDAVMPHFRDDRVAGVGGRMIEVCQDSVAGRWRAKFMPQHWQTSPSADIPFLFGADCVYRVSALRDPKVNGWCPRYKTNFEDVDLCRRLKAAGYLIQYEPNALARHLRKDDLAATLTNFWKWYKDAPEDAGMFDSMAEVTKKIAHNKDLASQRMAQAIADNEPTLTYPCWLLFTWLCLADLQYMAKKTGQDLWPTSLEVGRFAVESLPSLRRRVAADLAMCVISVEGPAHSPYVDAFRQALGTTDDAVLWMLETSVLALEAEA